MAIELVIGVGIGYIPCNHFLFLAIILRLIPKHPQMSTTLVSYIKYPKTQLLTSRHKAHLGGLLMGLLVGTTFYPVISVTKRHKSIMWLFRLSAIPLAIILFVVLTRNFYTSNPYAGRSSMITIEARKLLIWFVLSACSWCRYLSCFPTASNNHCKGCVSLIIDNSLQFVLMLYFRTGM